MKLALLGKGKTGSKVLELFSGEVSVFDSKRPPTFEELIQSDVIISFLPGESFQNLIPLLMETKKPVVTGSTGFTWPIEFDQTLQKKNLSWIYATNFSLGVVVMKHLIQKLQQMDHLFKEKNYSLHEVHHTKKLDAPSGTALSMKEWLNRDCPITSERRGDVVGLHTLSLTTPGEVIRLEHEALDRRLFAEGALWASQFIFHHHLPPGLHPFQQVVEKHLSL